MSDVSQGEGWWLASDGKWYPPWTQPAPGYDQVAQEAAETRVATTTAPTGTPGHAESGAPASGPGRHRRQPSRKVRRNRLVALVLLVVVVVVVVVTVAGSGGGGLGSYEVKVVGVSPNSVRTLSVSVQVTNQGSAPIKPMCAVSVTATVRGTHKTGTDTVKATTQIPPGKSTVLVAHITVSGTGATEITLADVKVTC